MSILLQNVDQTRDASFFADNTRRQACKERDPFLLHRLILKALQHHFEARAHSKLLHIRTQACRGYMRGGITSPLRRTLPRYILRFLWIASPLFIRSFAFKRMYSTCSHGTQRQRCQGPWQQRCSRRCAHQLDLLGCGSVGMGFKQQVLHGKRACVEHDLQNMCANH